MGDKISSIIDLFDRFGTEEDCVRHLYGHRGVKAKFELLLADLCLPRRTARGGRSPCCSFRRS